MSFTTSSDYERTLGEILTHTFEGKLSEFAIKEYCSKNNIECNEIDTSKSKLGTWDKIGLKIDRKNVSVKSSKGYSKLLILEVVNYFRL